MIGVVDIVGASHCPELIVDKEIAALRILMASVLPYDPHFYSPRRHDGRGDSRASRRCAMDFVIQREAYPAPRLLCFRKSRVEAFGNHASVLAGAAGKV